MALDAHVPLGRRRAQIPQSHRVIHRCREKCVVDRRHGKRRDAALVSSEVLQVFVVVERVVPHRVIFLRRSVHNSRRAMRKSRQVDAVLFTVERLDVLARAAVVQLDRLVVRRRHTELATIIVIQTCHAAVRLHKVFEHLGRLKRRH